MKKIICLFAFFCMIGCGGKPNFNYTGNQIAKDMQTKWVVLNPQGQLWGFSPEQKLEVKVIENRWTADDLLVYVEISSVASVPPPPLEPTEQTGGKTKKATADVINQPNSVELTGLAKLHYEHVGGNWYLVLIDGVNLIVKPR